MCGLVLSIKNYLEISFYVPQLTFSQIYPFQFARALFWILLLPSVIYLQRLFPLAGKQRFRNLGLHLLLSFGGMLANYVVRYLFASAWQIPVAWWTLPTLKNAALWAVIQFNPNNLVDVPIYWLIIAGAYIGELYRRQRDLEVVQAQLKTQVAEAELHALKQQLQPHFLFNALNAVAMLVREKQEDRAVDTLAQLSALLRKLIDNTRQQQVTIASELDFTQRYLEIEKVRFGDRLIVKYAVEDALLCALVPSLLLQPLVENAIKHGISRRSEPGCVLVTIAHVGEKLFLEVFNDPADDEPPPAVPRVHLGLETTRERLHKTYGDDFDLQCSFQASDGSRVRVILPLRLAPPESGGASHF